MFIFPLVAAIAFPFQYGWCELCKLTSSACVLHGWQAWVVKPRIFRRTKLIEACAEIRQKWLNMFRTYFFRFLLVIYFSSVSPIIFFVAAAFQICDKIQKVWIDLMETEKCTVRDVPRFWASRQAYYTETTRNALGKSLGLWKERIDGGKFREHIKWNSMPLTNDLHLEICFL